MRQPSEVGRVRVGVRVGVRVRVRKWSLRFIQVVSHGRLPT